MKTYGYAVLFSFTGYLGISYVLTIVRMFGALLAVTGKWYHCKGSFCGSPEFPTSLAELGESEKGQKLKQDFLIKST